MAGLYYEDFEIGRVYRHALSRTVTEADNILFSNMTLNPQPLHIDRHFAERHSEWGQPIVNSLFTLGLLVGITVNDLTLGTTVANLGMKETRFPHPLFHGDSVYASTKVLGKRPSKSRPDVGLVEFEHTATNQDDVVVAVTARTAMMLEAPRLMRSWLFVPGASERKLARAFEAGADILILDLEDSVAEPRKAAARALVREAAMDAPSPVAVRINPLGGPHAEADLAAILPAAPQCIVLPKCEAGRDVGHLSALLAVAEAEAGLADGATQIMAIATETAASLFGLGTYAGASRRLVALAWGMEDLSTALAATRTRTASGALTAPFALARTLCLYGAHAAGIAPLDTVHTAVRDEAALAVEAAEAAADGFFGKMAIHPAQVPIINAAFTPPADALAHAERVVAAFAADPAAGVLSLDGRMIDRPHLESAKRLIARAASLPPGR